VQAQQRLEQRRGRHHDAAARGARQVKADGQPVRFWAKKLPRAGRRRKVAGMRRAILPGVLLLLLAAPVAAGDDNPTLVGTVGPGFTIDLADAGGKHVDVLTAGTYTLLVHDQSEIHNFHLANKPDGLQLDVQTAVEFVGDQTFTIQLVPGRYAYACAPHWQVMNGSFTVVPAAPVVHPLSAGIDAKGRATLSAHSLAAGTYAISVRDRSRSAGFRLTGPGVNRRTGKTFTGSVTWKATLQKGTYRYGVDGAKTLRTLVVR
jgi:hypothetical protein